MVVFKYDGDLHTVNSTIKTTDGDWHSVQILKGTKNIRLQVDKNTKKASKADVEPVIKQLNN
jgi:hypothetical protein